MSLKSTIRTMNKINKRIIRDAEKRRRDLYRQHKAHEKMIELEQARYEVDVFENQVEIIKTIHVDCGQKWNWLLIKQSIPPFQPDEAGPKERQAKDKLDSYKPGFLDKIFNRSEAMVKKLEQDVLEAKTDDKKEYEEWKSSVELAEKVLQGDLNTYKEVLSELAPFEDINQLGSSFEVKFPTSEIAEITLSIHTEDVIPEEIKSLTKAGKLSTKQMPKGQYYELYQDYVCGCALRMAREMFALLPLQNVYIHALGEFLNTKTGHLDEGPVLSVQIPRATLEKLNFSKIDPSDSMTNFKYNMKFKKTQGFDFIEKLKLWSDLT